MAVVRRARLSVLVAVLAPALAQAQFPITQSFTGTTAPGWTLLGTSVLTANAGDTAGNGWLRLTTAGSDQAGTAYCDTAFPSSYGIVVTFDYADYGGTGADGFSVFLVDGATASPTVGSSGGPLGYAAKVDSTPSPPNYCSTGPQTVKTLNGSKLPGVTNGFVGVGFDEYGNFSNCEAGYASDGQLHPQSVAIRGSGSNGTGTQTAFRYLTGVAVTPAFTIDGVSRSASRRVRVSIINQVIKVEMDLTGTGNSYQTIIPGYDLATAPGQVPMPANFKLGISGSTGGSTNTHEIRNVWIDKPVNLTLTQTANPAGSILVGQVLTYTITIANDNTNDASSTALADAFPSGLGSVQWSCTATGGASAPSMSGTGNLNTTLSLPRSSSITCTVQGTVLSSALGTTLTNVVDVTPPSDSANLLTSSADTQVVVAMQTATSLTSSQPTTVYGQPTTLAATVTTVAPGSGTPTGTVTFLDGSTSLGQVALDGTGVARLTVSALHPATHTLTARYDGTSSYWTSTSAPVTQTVNQATSSTTVTTSGSPALYGQPVTLTARVTAVGPGAGIPTGSVTFLDGGNTLGTGPLALDGSGQATLTLSDLFLGVHSLSVAYGGSADFAASVSGTLSQSVVIASTTTTLSSTSNPSVFGQPVTLTATVAPVLPAGGNPTGNVSFFEAGVLLGTSPIVAGGQAQFFLAAPAMGGRAYTAVYAGSPDYGSSTSPVFTQVVTAASTTTALTSSPSPSFYGQAVTFTATVAPVAPSLATPTGTVTFSEGATTLGTGTLAGGQASFTTSAPLAAGSQVVTASYPGDTGFNPSSGTFTQQVNKASTTTTVTASPNPSAFGQAVTFTATVSPVLPGAGTPTGTVTFSEGATTLGTGSLAGGKATFTTSALLAGPTPQVVTASYGGDASFGVSSGNGSQLVSQAATTTTLAVVPSSSTYGQAVTFTATVAPVSPGAGIPTGTVTFSEGGTAVGSAPLIGGVASLSISSLSVLTHTLAAAYLGDPNFTTSTSATVTESVQKADTVTTVTMTPSPSVFGQTVTLTATVAAVPPGGGIPSGSVSFSDGGISLGSATLDGAGKATLTTSALSVGGHSLLATYAGSTCFNGSTSSVWNHTVGQAATATVVVGSPNPGVYGQLVTLTATVSANPPGAGTPGGQVTFYGDGTLLGSGALSGGAATLPGSTFSAGAHNLTASYGGDSSFTGSSSATFLETITPASTSVALSAAANPTAYGQPLALTATVTAGSGGTPGGTVTFSSDGVTLGTALLDGSGAATLTTSSTTGLSVGGHTLSASYGGAANFAVSTSPGLLHTVQPTSTTTSLVAGPSPSAFGETVTVTATVVAAWPAAGAPTGSVTFFDGSNTLGSASLDATGKGSLSTSVLSVGSHSLTASYAGAGPFQLSQSPAAPEQVVAAPTTTALDSSLPSSTYGQEVTLTATVAVLPPGLGTPTGTVTFTLGGVPAPLGTAALSGGIATLRVSSLPAGADQLTAQYAGDGNFTASTGTFTQGVSRATPGIALTSSANPVALGDPLTLTATLTGPLGAPGGTVTLKDGAAVLCQDVVVSSGVANCSPTLAVGPHILTAAASGDANHAPATSSSLDEVVNRAPSATALVVTPSSSVFGQAVTLAATVTAAGAGAGTPGGTVTFLDGGTVLGAATLGAGGVGALTLSTLDVLGHALTASYGGDDRYLSSTSVAVSLTVSKAATTVTLATSVPAPEAGQALTLTATVAVSAPGGASPGGTITFRDGSAVLGTGSVGASGVATLSVPGLAAGPHSLAAGYGGDAHLKGSTSAPLALSVSLAATAVSLTGSPNPSLYGQPVVLTAHVTVPGPGAGTPSGPLSFEENGTVLGSPALSGATATLALSSLDVGSHSIVARFPGDAALAPSASQPLSITVNPAATITVLLVAPSPAEHGEAVTLTATVTASAPGGGIPAGTVAFSDGSASLGTATLDASGQAVLTSSTLSTGAHALTAAYQGSPRHLSSTSPIASLTVNRDPTTVTITSSRNPSRHGRPVIFTVTVSASSGTPDGTVTVKDGGTVLGQLSLSAGSAQLATRDLKKGTHPITADYAGSADYAPASGSLAGGEVVENSPPVAGAGTALLLGPGGATGATLGAPSAADPTQGTVELWLEAGWTAPDQVGGAPSILVLGSAAAPRLSLSLSPDRQDLSVTLGSASTSVTASLDDGAWHHLALSSGAGQVLVVLDGAPLAALEGAFGAGDPGDLTLGEGFIGELDDLRIWTPARSAEAIAASRYQPLHGDEEGLAALWRFDEGGGSEIFDSGPAHLDGTALVADGNSAFAPSAAWRDRIVPEDHPLSIDAGYDPDGDPLTLTVTVRPKLGTAGVDTDRLEVRYEAPAEAKGTDALTFALSDGEDGSSYAVQVEVTAPQSCQAVSTCPSGDECVQGVCTAPGRIVARSGGGCSSSPGTAAPWALLSLLLLCLRRRAVPARVLGRAARTAIGLVLLAATEVRAQAPAGFDLQTLEPPPPGDRFFAVPDADVEGQLRPALGLTGSYTTRPLLLMKDGHELPGGRVVDRSMWSWVQASLVLSDLVEVDAALPAAMAQDGSKPIADLDRVSRAAIGDLRLGARAGLPFLRAFHGAAGLDVWLPTGDRDAFASDGSVRVEPKAIASGEVGPVVYAADVGLLLRRDRDLGVLTRTGNAVQYGLGVAVRLGGLRIGPELFGRRQFQGGATSPAEVLLGAHYRLGPFELGLAAGTALNDSPGAAPFRLVAGLSWRPGAESARVPPAAAAQAPPVGPVWRSL